MTLTMADLGEVEKIVAEKVDEKTSNLPTKYEFYEETAKVLKKLDDLQEAVDIISSRQAEHSDKIEAIEKIHPRGAHPASV